MEPDRQRVMAIGAGYVGLATAIGLAAAGHHVELVEVRRDRLDAFVPARCRCTSQASVTPSRMPARGEIDLSASPSPAQVDVVLLCVGTPLDDDGQGHLGQVKSALDAVADHLSKGAILVIRSTLPVGSS